MCVQFASRQFDRFADHDAEGDLRETQFVGEAKRLTDKVAILNESIGGKVGEASLEVPLATSARVEYEMIAVDRLAHLQLTTYRLNKGLARIGTYDPCSAEDGDAI